MPKLPSVVCLEANQVLSPDLIENSSSQLSVCGNVVSETYTTTKSCGNHTVDPLPSCSAPFPSKPEVSTEPPSGPFIPPTLSGVDRNTIKETNNTVNSKLQWLSPVLSKLSTPVSFCLEELLHDYFRAVMDRGLLSEERLNVVVDFHKYLKELHCHENLEVIMEIYKYEYFYEKINGYQTKDPNSNLDPVQLDHSEYLNSSLELYIDNLPYPTSSMRKIVRRNSRRSRRSQSIGAVEPFPLDFYEPAPEVTEVWANFCDNKISSNSDHECLLEMEPAGLMHDSSIDALLTEQWSYIINNFIVPNLTSQINLSKKTVNLLLDLDATKSIVHKPLVFRSVQSEVMLLLWENAFYPFMRKLNLQERKIFEASSASPVPEREPVLILPLTGSSKNTSNTNLHACSLCDNKSYTPQRSSSVSVKQSEPAVAAPVPSKRISKLFPALASDGSGKRPSSPSGSLTGILTLLKVPALGGNGYMAFSAPHSPPSATRSRLTTSSLVRTVSGTSESVLPDGSSILGKLWRKKR